MALKPRASLRVGALVVALVLASVVGAGLPGLTASSPVNLDQAIESIDESVCQDYAISNVSEQCADWVNKCCLTWAFPYMDLVAGPNGERVYAFATGNSLSDPAHVAAIDPETGQTLWHSMTPRGPQIGSITVSPDEWRVFVTADDADGRIMTIAYDTATGEQVWITHRKHEGSPYDYPLDIAIGPDGERVFVTGDERGEYVILAYETITGGLLWNGTHDHRQWPAGDQGRAVGVSPDGSRVFVAGTVLKAPTEGAWNTIAYNASTGEQAWKHVVDVGFGKPQDVTTGPTGKFVFVTGSAGGRTLAYHASTGQLAWRDRPAGGWGAEAIAVSPDGSSVFITGGAGEIATIAYNVTTGDQIWSQEHGSPMFLLADDEGRDLVVSPDSSTVYVAGVAWRYTDLLIQGIEDPTYVTLAYDASNGTQQWAARYDAMGLDDIPFAIDVAPNGSRVFVVGQSVDPDGGSTAVTLAYNATGPNPVIEPLVDGAT